MGFFVVVACWGSSIGILFWIPYLNGQYWIGTYLVGGFIDFAIFDFITAASNGFHCEFFKKRGFWYDFSLGEAFALFEEE